MRDVETIDSELRLVAALRRAAREQGGPLPSIAVADALLDEHLRAHPPAALFRVTEPSQPVNELFVLLGPLKQTRSPAPWSCQRLQP
jgi:hypothetical protein